MTTKPTILETLESLLSQPEIPMENILELWIEMNKSNEIEILELDRLVQKISVIEESNKILTEQNSDLREQCRKHTVRFGVLKNLSKEISKKIDDEIQESKSSSETKKQERIESNNQFSKRLAAISERLQVSTNRRKAIEDEKQWILTEIQDCLSKITASESFYEKTTTAMKEFDMNRLDEQLELDNERYMMTKEDQRIYLNQYTLMECSLRRELVDYARMFDLIHFKLDESRKVYSIHQTKINELEKHIKIYEKNNSKLQKKLYQTEKNVEEVLNQNQALENELQKTTKAIQRYNSLITVFESEISHLAM